MGTPPHAAYGGPWHHGANTVGADGVRGRLFFSAVWVTAAGGLSGDSRRWVIAKCRLARSANSRLRGDSRVGCGFITWSLAKQPHLLTHALESASAVLMLAFGSSDAVCASDPGCRQPADAPGAKIGRTRAALDCGVDTIRRPGAAKRVATRCYAGDADLCGGSAPLAGTRLSRDAAGGRRWDWRTGVVWQPA